MVEEVNDMTRHQEPWWAEAQSIIYNYPAYKSTLVSKEYSLSAVKYDGVGHSKGLPSKPVENEAVKRVDDMRLQYMEHAVGAVDKAIQVMGDTDTGKNVLQYVAMRYWKKEGSHRYISNKLDVHPNTAGKWNVAFVKMVGKNMGFW